MPDAAESFYDSIGQAVEQAMQEDGVPLTRATAWNFVYRYGMGVAGDLPHIVEANELRRAAWRTRGRRALAWLTKNLVPGTELTAEDSLSRLNTAWRMAPDFGYSGNESNLAGSSLEYALAYLVERLCGVRPLVKKSIRDFRGYEIAKRAEVEQLDLALFSCDDLRLFISAFWTTRKDRIAADLYEATFLRRRRPDVGIAFVVNEFRRGLLLHLLNAPDVDRVYHVCLDALLAAYAPFEGTVRLTQDELLGSSAAVDEYQTYLTLRQSVKGLDTLFEDIDRLKPGN